MSEQPEALTNVPENLNYLSPLSFKFTMKRAPTVNYFLHKVNVPGLNLPTVANQTPFVNLPQSGDHVEYNPLVATFRVDENLQNYFEIHDWMIKLAKAENFDQYKSLKVQPDWTGLGIHSEITLTILDSKRNPKYTFHFLYCLPTLLTDLQFDAAMNDVQYLTATVTFEYQSFSWNLVV